MTNQWLVNRFNIASFIGDLTWLNLLLRVLRALVSVLVSQVWLLVSLNNGGNGLLSGLLGGSNQNMISTLQAENSLLKAENYSDKNAKEVYMQFLADNCRLRDKAFAFIKPLADEGCKQPR